MQLELSSAKEYRVELSYTKEQSHTTISTYGVSNQRNPAARHYTGMSAAAERGMVTRIMRLYEGYGDVYIHGSQVVRSARFKESRNTSSHFEAPPPHTENTVFLHTVQ